MTLKNGDRLGRSRELSSKVQMERGTSNKYPMGSLGLKKKLKDIVHNKYHEKSVVILN